MDKKTILAFLLIGLIIILMPYYYKLINPEQAEKPAEIQDTTKTETSTTVMQTEAGIAPVQETLKKTIVPRDTVFAFNWQDSAVKKEAQFTVETPLYHAVFNSAGATVSSFKLKKFAGRKGGLVEMIPSATDQSASPKNAYINFPRLGLSSDKLYYCTDNQSTVIKEGDTARITLIAKLKNGGTIENIYTFNGKNYVIDLEIQTQGLKLEDEYYFCWDGGVNLTETDTAQDLYYSKAYAMMGGEMEKLDVPGRGERRLNPSGKVDWMAVRSKYFQVAVIPQGNSQGIDFLASKTGPQRNAPKDFKLALKMEGPEGEIKQKFTLYIGPMDSKNLSELNVGLEETMNWGWIVVKPFSIGTLWLFKLLHQFIPNYGLVIIVFAVIVKIVLWPLTHKSYESMKKMQELQPYLKEIREKYKGDAAKMQKATAELYKEHKVNPLGGCLPVLLQMPLLIALFNVFRSTIELRGQPFCLWIKDLSLPDTVIKLNFTIPMYGNQVSVLPILMGVSTFFQSKTSMTDPNQKMMLYFMPIFLLLMFNNFPSGLTLYYTLFNIFSMVQQKMAHGEIRILSSSATKSARQKSLK